MQWSRPEPSEVEVSVFGPGIGESILIHLGYNEWLIVDSCIDKETSTPETISYLQRIGVSADAIKYIIVSHWHDDHIQGLHHVVDAAPDAKVVCSNALRSKEFTTLLSTSKMRFVESSGVDEMRCIYDSLLERHKGRKGSVGFVWASENRRIAQDRNYEIYSLSLSDGTFSLALEEIFNLIPSEKESKRKYVVQSPNSLSVVLWVRIGNRVILLGGDLQNTNDSRTGWSAIISSEGRPKSKAQIFKVPHHGSSNADNPAILSDLLVISPDVVLTPYTSGRKPLPSTEDLKRIREKAGRVFLTAPSSIGKPPKRSPVVEKTIRETAISRRRLIDKMGIVRFRMQEDVDSPPTVELEGKAFQILN